ncbi:MAG TPA: hypothetical protein VGG45_10750 [Terracidiphilus sp.]
MSSETIETILELVPQVQDESKPVEERRAALRHIAALKGEAYPAIPDADFSAVAGAICPQPGFGIELFEQGMSLAAAAEGVAKGRLSRGLDQRRK